MKCSNLRTERLPAARGIVTGNPEFTWALTAERDDECQTACEIEVDCVAPDGSAAPVWRSGKLAKRIGDEVRYAGDALAVSTAGACGSGVATTRPVTGPTGPALKPV